MLYCTYAVEALRTSRTHRVFRIWYSKRINQPEYKEAFINVYMVYMIYDKYMIMNF